MAPSQGFAVVGLTNGPDGPGLREELRRWALATYLGVVVRDPEPADLSDDELAEYAGVYVSSESDYALTVHAHRLLLTIEDREPLASVAEDAPQRFPTVPLGLLPGPGDRHIITAGPYKGIRGYFTRDDAGVVNGLHFGGVLLPRAR
jgi:hypothetical protein